MSSNAVSMIRLSRHAEAPQARAGAAHSAARELAQKGSLAGWADLLGSPSAETTRSRDLAHLGGFTAMAALIGYLAWRVAFTLPATGANRLAAFVLIAFEAVPLVGMAVRMVTLWNIDSAAPAPVSEAPGDLRVAVLIPTYDEPA